MDTRRPRQTQRRDGLEPKGETPQSPQPEETSREFASSVDLPPPGLEEAKGPPREPSERPTSQTDAEKSPRQVEFTHADRVVFPEVRLTKGDILGFYQRVAPYLLPYLCGRPVTVERLPEGLNGAEFPHFWQKNTPAHYPSWIRRVNLPTEQGKDVWYALVDDVQTLLYLVNQGAVTFHVYLSTVEHLERPDWVLFDLDPGESTFANAVTVARQIHLLLDAVGIPSSPKTSGKTGIHVLAPWREEGGYDQARVWAMRIAQYAVGMSDLATTQRIKRKREGRVYIDVVQNAMGHHVVPPYVLRAVPAATVSTPLSWRELRLGLDPKQFDVWRVLERLASRGRDPMARILRG